MYYIIKLYYVVAVLSLTYTPILPTFFKNNKRWQNKKTFKKRKKPDQNKKNVKNVFCIYGLKRFCARESSLVLPLPGRPLAG